MYEFVVYLHVLFVTLYLMLFSFRIYFLVTGKEERLLLFIERSRHTHTVILAVLLITGLYLGFTYDFTNGMWFVVKLGLLVATVFAADYAFRNFHKGIGLLSYAIFLYIILMSFFKPFGLP